jgi:uncharacterized protein (TIGR00730 family)
MFPLKNITVYCGSNTGILPEYTTQAKSLAKEMVKRKLGLVYGAGKVGLMGVIADEMLHSKSPVYGIIPQKLVDIEVAHQGCTELVVVETMRDRKWLMAEKGDGFIAMPGGIGTLEELFEIMMLDQLSYIQKPLALYNVAGYYDKLLDFLAHVYAQGFLKKQQIDSLIIASDPALLLDKMEAFQPGNKPDWM